MTQDKLISTLENFGLSENEAKVYFASLSLGPATILQIARVAQIKRTTVYTIVESLKNKGLMQIVIKGFKQLFVPYNPEQLENILEERKTTLKQSMPELLALYNLKGGESYIKYYEGLESVKTIYNDLLSETKPKSDYSVISDTEKWFELDPKFYTKFQERRAKKSFNIRILTRTSKIARDHQKREKNLNMEVKLLPDTYTFLTNLIIVPHKIVFHQLIPPIMAIVIENKSVIQMNQMLFNLLWDSIE